MLPLVGIPRTIAKFLESYRKVFCKEAGFKHINMTAKESYEQMEQVRERLLELLHYQKNRLAYRKRTEIAVEIVRQLETEGQFPDADYAFDQGVLSRPLTEVIEASSKALGHRGRAFAQYYVERSMATS